MNCVIARSNNILKNISSLATTTAQLLQHQQLRQVVSAPRDIALICFAFVLLLRRLLLPYVLYKEEVVRMRETLMLVAVVLAIVVGTAGVRNDLCSTETTDDCYAAGIDDSSAIHNSTAAAASAAARAGLCESEKVRKRNELDFYC